MCYTGHVKTKRKLVEGRIVKVEKNALCIVALESGEEVQCVPRRKLFRGKIHLLLGDDVQVEIIPNSQRHWIVWRGKKKGHN